MSKWVATTLGDLIALEYGKALPERLRDGQGAPVLGSNGVVGRHSQPLLQGPGLVVGRKGTAGSVTWVDSDFFPIDTTYYVRLRDKNRLTMQFASLLLTEADLPSVCAQTGVPGLNRDRAYELSVLLPPLGEQRRIVDIVAAVDAHDAALAREVATTHGLVRAVLNGIVDEARERSIGLSRLQDLLAESATYGVLKPGDEVPGGVPLIRGQDIIHGTVLPDSLRTISRALDQEYRRSRVQAGDVVIVLVGTPGPCALVPEALDGANISRAVGRLRCGPGLLPEFLLMILNSPEGQATLRAETRGAVQQMINLKELKELTIPVPTVEDQVALASRGRAVIDLATTARGARESLGHVRAALVKALLSADIAIPGSYDELLEAS